MRYSRFLGTPHAIETGAPDWGSNPGDHRGAICLPDVPVVKSRKGAVPLHLMPTRHIKTQNGPRRALSLPPFSLQPLLIFCSLPSPYSLAAMTFFSADQTKSWMVAAHLERTKLLIAINALAGMSIFFFGTCSGATFLRRSSKRKVFTV